MVVEQNRAIHLQNPELKPGSRVEAIVLAENEAQHAGGKPLSFLEGGRRLAIDAPPDFPVAFEKNLYGHGH